MAEELDEFDEEDMMRAFARISQSRRSSAVALADACAPQSHESCDSSESGDNLGGKAEYRVVVLGSSGTGKTAIISQFLYDTFVTEYKETVEEMYHGEFDVGGCELTLNIQDTGGSYVDDFPAMVGVSLSSADAVLLVYSVADSRSFEEVSRLRDLALSKVTKIPIVVVGNMTDLPRDVNKGEAEARVMFDWENGYMECCAKEKTGIVEVFQELLNQAKSKFDFRTLGSSPLPNIPTPGSMTRRKSLPQVPAFCRLKNNNNQESKSSDTSPVTSSPPHPIGSIKRRSSFINIRKQSCTTQ